MLHDGIEYVDGDTESPMKKEKRGRKRKEGEEESASDVPKISAGVSDDPEQNVGVEPYSALNAEV